MRNDTMCTIMKVNKEPLNGMWYFIYTPNKSKHYMELNAKLLTGDLRHFVVECRILTSIEYTDGGS
jgi:hypothetical protein